MTLPRKRLPLAWHIGLALLAGLALRLLLVLRFPATTNDTVIYEELARNWLKAHVFGLDGQNRLAASDIRVPGYPAFLISVYLVLGRGQAAILLAQALLDLCTCGLVAWLASRLAFPEQRRRVGLTALWLAATCPLVANYAAVPLTETLATFLTAAALIPLVRGCISLNGEGPTAGEGAAEGASPRPWWPWLAGGFLAGLGTLVRPETPLLLAAFALVLCVRLRRPADWGKLARIGALTAIGLLLPLAPWAVRNWLSLHQVQFLAPRYANGPGEFVPRGLYAWTGTWLVRYRDVYLVPWKADGDPIELSDIPPSAFDSPDEKARVAALLDRYDDTLDWTPDIDESFAELARERTARHPLRTYLTVPMERGFTIWFTPRTELLPVTGHLTPLREMWDQDPVDFAVSVLLGALNFFYAGLGLAGFARGIRLRPAMPREFSTALALLAAFIVVRTLFLTTVETPEPRYVLECFPALLALAALAWLKQPEQIRADAGR